MPDLGAEIFIFQLPIKLFTIFHESIKNNSFICYNNINEGYSHFVEFNNTKVNLYFSNNEEEKGRSLLADMGIGKEDWFICFHTRDSKYLKKNTKYY